MIGARVLLRFFHDLFYGSSANYEVTIDADVPAS